MNVEVKVDIDPEMIAKRTPKADHELAVQAQKDTERYVPMLTGALRNGTQVNGGEIIYPGPYAHYQWVGDVYVDPKLRVSGIPWKGGWFSRKGVTKVNSGRKLQHKTGQDHWFDASKAMNMNKWLNVYRKAISSGQ